MAVVGGLDSHVGQLVRLQVEFVHICTIHVIFFCYCILLYVFVLSTFRSHIRAVSEQLLLLAILVKKSKFTPGNFFTQTPSVVSVTNKRYG